MAGVLRSDAALKATLAVAQRMFKNAVHDDQGEIMRVRIVVPEGSVIAQLVGSRILSLESVLDTFSNLRGQSTSRSLYNMFIRLYGYTGDLNLTQSIIQKCLFDHPCIDMHMLRAILSAYARTRCHDGLRVCLYKFWQLHSLTSPTRNVTSPPSASSSSPSSSRLTVDMGNFRILPNPVDVMNKYISSIKKSCNPSDRAVLDEVLNAMASRYETSQGLGLNDLRSLHSPVESFDDVFDSEHIPLHRTSQQSTRNRLSLDDDDDYDGDGDGADGTDVDDDDDTVIVAGAGYSGRYQSKGTDRETDSPSRLNLLLDSLRAKFTQYVEEDAARKRRLTRTLVDGKWVWVHATPPTGSSSSSVAGHKETSNSSLSSASATSLSHVFHPFSGCVVLQLPSPHPSAPLNDKESLSLTTPTSLFLDDGAHATLRILAASHFLPSLKHRPLVRTDFTSIITAGGFAGDAELIRSALLLQRQAGFRPRSYQQEALMLALMSSGRLHESCLVYQEFKKRHAIPSRHIDSLYLSAFIAMVRSASIAPALLPYVYPPNTFRACAEAMRRMGLDASAHDEHPVTAVKNLSHGSDVTESKTPVPRNLYRHFLKFATRKSSKVHDEDALMDKFLSSDPVQVNDSGAITFSLPSTNVGLMDRALIVDVAQEYLDHAEALHRMWRTKWLKSGVDYVGQHLGMGVIDDTSTTVSELGNDSIVSMEAIDAARANAFIASLSSLNQRISIGPQSTTLPDLTSSIFPNNLVDDIQLVMDSLTALHPLFVEPDQKRMVYWLLARPIILSTGILRTWGGNCIDIPYEQSEYKGKIKKWYPRESQFLEIINAQAMPSHFITPYGYYISLSNSSPCTPTELTHSSLSNPHASHPPSTSTHPSSLESIHADSSLSMAKTVNLRPIPGASMQSTRSARKFDISEILGETPHVLGAREHPSAQFNRLYRHDDGTYSNSAGLRLVFVVPDQPRSQHSPSPLTSTSFIGDANRFSVNSPLSSDVPHASIHETASNSQSSSMDDGDDHHRSEMEMTTVVPLTRYESNCLNALLGSIFHQAARRSSSFNNVTPSPAVPSPLPSSSMKSPSSPPSRSQSHSQSRTPASSLSSTTSSPSKQSSNLSGFSMNRQPPKKFSSGNQKRTHQILHFTKSNSRDGNKH